MKTYQKHLSSVGEIKEIKDLNRKQVNRTSSIFPVFHSKKISSSIFTKSGIMLGLGEKIEEVEILLRDLKSANVDFVTVGQYMQPTKKHLPVVEFITPEKFAYFKEVGLSLGFEHVESSPLVRSSYHAEKHI